ncbi:hypothetical protein G9O61_00g021700, partial [Vairimorpha ceranae]
MRPAKTKLTYLGETDPGNRPKTCKMEWAKLIVYNESTIYFHGVRRFDVIPLTHLPSDSGQTIRRIIPQKAAQKKTINDGSNISD